LPRNKREENQSQARAAMQSREISNRHWSIRNARNSSSSNKNLTSNRHLSWLFSNGRLETVSASRQAGLALATAQRSRYSGHLSYEKWKHGGPIGVLIIDKAIRNRPNALKIKGSTDF
jgi:hypothetical protein